MKKWQGIPVFEWQGMEWIGRPNWGISHPRRPVWYDSEMVTVDDNGCLIVGLENHEREMAMYDSIVKRRWETGYCRSVQEFKYGTFEWEAIMPMGTNLWPALWLASDTSWPPEIDCVEGWSNNNPKYIKRLFFRNMHPTMHWSEEGKLKSEPKYNIHRGWINGPMEFTSYKVVWTPEYVDVFYGKHLVKRFEDEKMLEQLNKEGIMMHPIMSLNVQSAFGDQDFEKYKELGQPFMIRSFKYTPWEP